MVSGLAAVTLISHDTRFAATPTRVVTLSAQRAWGEGGKNLLERKKKTPTHYLPFSHTRSWVVTHQQGYSCRASSADLDPLCSSCPGSARNWLRPCCRRSCGSDLRDPWRGTEPGRRRIRCSCHCSCMLETHIHGQNAHRRNDRSIECRTIYNVR